MINPESKEHLTLWKSCEGVSDRSWKIWWILSINYN